MEGIRDALSRIEGLLARISQQMQRQPTSSDEGDRHRPNNPATIVGSVSITNQPIGVNVQNTPTVQAQQTGTWTVSIANQPIAVSIDEQPIQVSPVQPTYKYAVVSASTSGDTQVVAAVSGKKIRVVAFALVAAGTVNVKFKRSTTDITGSMRLVEAGGIAHAFAGGLFETGVNQALVINLSASVQVGGYVVYEEV